MVKFKGDLNYICYQFSSTDVSLLQIDQSYEYLNICWLKQHVPRMPVFSRAVSTREKKLKPVVSLMLVANTEEAIFEVAYP